MGRAHDDRSAIRPGARRRRPWSRWPCCRRPGPPASPASAPARARRPTTPSTLPDGTARPDRGRRGPRQHLRARPARPRRHRRQRRRDRRRPPRPTASRRPRWRRTSAPRPVINAADAACNIAVAADRGDRPRRVRPRPLRRQHPRRRRRLAAPASSASPLDGSNGTAEITDTDAGQYDNDQKFDRAVGPMQFIPSTWSVVGVDGDGDGKRNPQDIDDAALATAVYLCSGDDDLGTDAGPGVGGLPLQPQRRVRRPGAVDHGRLLGRRLHRGARTTPPAAVDLHPRRTATRVLDGGRAATASTAAAAAPAPAAAPAAAAAAAPTGGPTAPAGTDDPAAPTPTRSTAAPPAGDAVRGPVGRSAGQPTLPQDDRQVPTARQRRPCRRRSAWRRPQSRHYTATAAP